MKCRSKTNTVLFALLGTLVPCLALSPDCADETTAVKGEVRMLSPEVTAVKIEVNAGGSNATPAQAPPGMDERAGQKGATEYEGRELHCRDEGDGKKFCW